MKCIVAVLLVALFAVAFAAERPVEPEKIEQTPNVELPQPGDAPRDKRGVLLSYSSPLTYASYASPISYTAGYSLPYAYRSYPYYYGSYSLW